MRQDLKDAAPILESLSGDLNDPAVRASLENMPKTVAALMRIQADLSSGSEIMKALQNAAQPETLSTASGIVKTLDQIEPARPALQIHRCGRRASSLLGRVQAWLNLSKEYGLYTPGRGWNGYRCKIHSENRWHQGEKPQPAQAPAQEESGVVAGSRGCLIEKAKTLNHRKNTKRLLQTHVAAASPYQKHRFLSG